MPVQIIREDRGGKNEQWILDINNELLTLVTPSGEVLIQWTPAQVAEGVVFPSFSKSIKFAGFNVVQRGQFQFNMHPQTLRELREFANRGIASKGPGAIRSVLIVALLTTIGGFLLMCFGLIAIAVTIYEFKTGKAAAGGHPVGVVSCLIGIAVLCRGIYGFYHYAKLKKLAAPNIQSAVVPPPIQRQK